MRSILKPKRAIVLVAIFTIISGISMYIWFPKGHFLALGYLISNGIILSILWVFFRNAG